MASVDEIELRCVPIDLGKLSIPLLLNTLLKIYHYIQQILWDVLITLTANIRQNGHPAIYQQVLL